MQTPLHHLHRLWTSDTPAASEAVLEIHDTLAATHAATLYAILARCILAGDQDDDTPALFDPTLLMSPMLHYSTAKTHMALCTLRWYVWRSRRFYHDTTEGAATQLMQQQDLLIVVELLALLRHRRDDRATARTLGSALHQLLLETPALIRILFDEALIDEDQAAMLIELVPSLHVAIDWMPELLRRTVDTERWLHHVAVASHLALKYPLAKTLELCKECLTQLEQRPAEINAQAATRLVRSLCRMLIAFPILIDKIALLCQEWKQRYAQADGFQEEVEWMSKQVHTVLENVDRPIYRKDPHCA